MVPSVLCPRQIHPYFDSSSNLNIMLSLLLAGTTKAPSSGATFPTMIPFFLFLEAASTFSKGWSYSMLHQVPGHARFSILCTSLSPPLHHLSRETSSRLCTLQWNGILRELTVHVTFVLQSKRESTMSFIRQVCDSNSWDPLPQTN